VTEDLAQNGACAVADLMWLRPAVGTPVSNPV